VVNAPRERFLAWASGTELGDLLRGDNGLPSVVRTDPLRGDPDPGQDRTGHRRRIVLGDGHFTAEEILVDQPDVFRYIVWGYTNYAGLLIDHAIGEFRFEPLGERTRVSWTYSFRPRPVLARPFLSRFVHTTWARLMRDTLEAMRTGGEQNLTSS
jgi:Polyketide cyclase / dehydrase and lipid transport